MRAALRRRRLPVAMLARDRERLAAYENDIPGSRGFVCDVADLDALTAAAAKAAAEMGAPRVLIHNAVSGILDGGGAATFLESEPTRLERNFRVNTTVAVVSRLARWRRR